MTRIHTAVVLSITLLVLSGCGEGYASVRTAHPPLGHRRVETQQAAYQFSKGRVIETVLARTWALPGGEAVPDYEYVRITVPDGAGEYQVGDPGVEVVRLVRIEREEFLYKAVSGTVDYRFAWLTKDHVHLDFEVETELLAPPGVLQRRWHLAGEVKANESVTMAQGLINRYAATVERLSGQAKAGAAGNAP